MGLTHVAVSVIFGVALVASLGMAVPAALDAEEAMREAREDAHAIEEIQDGWEVNTSFALYDAVTDILVIEIDHQGTTPIELDEITFMLDGIATFATSAVIADAESSAFWLPGETATFTLTTASMPSRILVVGPSVHGAALATQAEGVISAYPVGFEIGSGAAKTRYFQNVALNTEKTSFSGGVTMKNGAETYVTDVLRIRNPEGSSHTVQFTATQNTNANIEALAWIVKNGGTEVGRLNFKASTPSLQFTFVSGASYTMDFWMDLRDGSGDNNVNGAIALTMVVS